MILGNGKEMMSLIKENKSFGNLKHKKPHKVAFYRIDEPELRIRPINTFNIYIGSTRIGKTNLFRCTVR